MKKFDYVLITPARDEAEVIKNTIESMVAQTVRPLRWIIVDDASVDDTRQIVEEAIKDHPFIKLVTVDRDGDRNFGSKALAFRHGLEQVEDVDYEYVGCLDADMELPECYYETVLNAFQGDPKLGIGGACIGTLVNGRFATNDSAPDSVGGAVQLFRRECFERVGGYEPLRWGGIDAVAELKVKAMGYKVEKVGDLRAVQQRDTGCAETLPLRAKFREGIRFHSLGYGGFFYLLRCIYRVCDRPVVLGSIASLFGYFDSILRRRPIVVEPEVRRQWGPEFRRRMARRFSPPASQ